jgi:ubiquitin-protein ligase
MAKYTKKWDKEFTKRYSNCMKELESLEKEFKEMVDSNPDEYISIYPDPSNIELGNQESFYVYDFGNVDEPHVDIQLSTKNGSFNFTFTELKKLIELRDDLIKAIDTFKRPLEKEKNIIDSDCEEDLPEDTEETEWEIKAERSLTESWTYTVTAKSACEAIKKLEEDPDQDDVVNNDDSEYYDYGDIEYESI